MSHFHLFSVATVVLIVTHLLIATPTSRRRWDVRSSWESSRAKAPLAEPIQRLLAPRPRCSSDSSPHRAIAMIEALAAGVLSAVALGHHFGETVVRALPGVIT